MYPILFKIGSFSFYSYGFFSALAIVVCVLFLKKECVKNALDFEKIFSCFFWAVLGGIIGGRLLFVIINFEEYIKEPLRILSYREGGMAFQGALIGGILAGYLACWIKKEPFLKICDIVAPYLALGHAIGRIGCFMNGCCYGKIVKNGIGVILQGEAYPRVPIQLYYSIGLVIIFFILKKLLDSPKKFNGFIFLMYIIFYSFFRFFMEFFRADNSLVFFGMTLAQVISIGTFFIGLILFVFLSRKKVYGRV
ncbi:Prolipoprotein diacylglyceryl transferase [Candidatus Omnitrophus magneticus]|uniref:Phosphatidylglycerol--prolipoprotein diacylglyceryl transferase n=1 Tax=Candidatus Omnitrophus magneticus TaxID=1609969 RepID=A0A0F0CPA5_9BACT|nr:Prolipoprotein diacylglyceryl transferase [Candidatus Omnitrophus magneticus]